jgi:hypothetical protein
MGEPINIVLSADSDAAVLKDQETSGGFRTWMLCVCRVVQSGRYCADAAVGRLAGTRENALASMRVPTRGLISATGVVLVRPFPAFPVCSTAHTNA